jgi:hypothetical protein
MKKIMIVSLLVLFFSKSLNAQSLENKLWIKTKVERKDTVNLSRQNIETAELKYFFKPNGKVRIINQRPDNELNYSIDKSLLKIGPFQKMEIEQLTDSTLNLAVVPDADQTPDKTYRFYFIAEEYYSNYLFRNNLINKLNDSTIITNSYARPIFKKDNILEYIKDKMDMPYIDSYITGSFLISPSGYVSDIKFTQMITYTSKMENKFRKILNGTTKCWELPKLNRPYYYLVNFTVKFSQKTYYHNQKFNILSFDY